MSETQKKKYEISEKVKDYLVRAHSFQEVGTEQMPDKDYDVLHFPHMIFAAGVIMGIYGYFIIYISSGISAYLDGIAVLIVGNIVATVGMIVLLKKYWFSFLILLSISIGLIIGMMIIWDFAIIPWAESRGLALSIGESGVFWLRTSLVLLTMMTFAYTACFIWYMAARYTSLLYFKFYAPTEEKTLRYFIVDPWRKVLKSKSSLIKDIIGRVDYPFLFLLTILMTLIEVGDLYFIQINWDSYFEEALIMYILLCAMVVLFPSFWLLDYVRIYDDERLEVRSLGRQVEIIIYGYAGIGTVISFISRSQTSIESAILEFYMLALYLIPTLIVLIGGYVLLTERDVYFIADKIVHGNKVIVDYKLIDSKGSELKWWKSKE